MGQNIEAVVIIRNEDARIAAQDVKRLRAKLKKANAMPESCFLKHLAPSDNDDGFMPISELTWTDMWSGNSWFADDGKFATATKSSTPSFLGDVAPCIRGIIEFVTLWEGRGQDAIGTAYRIVNGAITEYDVGFTLGAPRPPR